jgi:acyl carrier protein
MGRRLTARVWPSAWIVGPPWRLDRYHKRIMNATVLSTPESHKAELADLLRACLPKRIQGISGQTPIAALRLDSLEFVELLCALEAQFNVSLTVEEFQSVTTVGELVALIHCKTTHPRSAYALR